MGGNALKNARTRRLDRQDYERVSIAVVARLREAFPSARVEVIPAYATKADFGDLDVLVTAEDVLARGGADALKRLAIDAFCATELVANGSVLSFDYRADAAQAEPGFQVDVITMPRAEYAFALDYFSYNDLGNLVGRTAHKQGASFGHDGLWYIFRDGDYKFRDVLLTRDFDHALRFLGYDPRRFRAGFADLRAIFEYVAGSAFFNRSIFLLENRNYQSRVRDRKRKTYTGFLQWCEEQPELPAFRYPADKADWLPRMFEWFPAFRAEYDRTLEDLATQRAVKERFNGELVSAWTGLADKPLGALMREFKASFESPQRVAEFVLAASEEELRARVRAVAARLGKLP